MKKLILSIACVIGGFAAANANMLTAINTTSCYMMISTQGGYIFLAPAGMAGSTKIYNSPANINDPNATPSGTFTSAKVINDATDPVTGPWTGIQVNVATTPTSAQLGTSSSGVPCHGGNAYNVSWIPSNGDITLVIV